MRQQQFRFAVTTLAGSTLRNISDLRRDYIIEPSYRNKFRFSIAVAALLELLNPVERMVWQRRIRQFRPEVPPVFIVGFWRSGTTLLHNLLCQDPQTAYTTTFQTVFPNLVLTQSWWLKPIVNMVLPKRRPYDNVNMDMDFPQEEDFGLMNMQPSTIYKFFIFPKDYNRILETDLFTERLKPGRLEQWKTAYMTMIAKAVFNTRGRRYIGKNPCHLSRIRLLLDLFPDARFIFIHREPYKVIESLYQFMLTVFPGVQLQDVPDTFTRRQVVDLYVRMMQAWFATKDQIPSGNLVELNYHDFLEDIQGSLHTIYTQLGLGDYSRISGVTDQFLRQNPYPEHNSVPPEPETIRLVDEHASDIRKKLGYQ